MQLAHPHPEALQSGAVLHELEVIRVQLFRFFSSAACYRHMLVELHDLVRPILESAEAKPMPDLVIRCNTIPYATMTWQMRRDVLRSAVDYLGLAGEGRRLVVRDDDWAAIQLKIASIVQEPDLAPRMRVRQGGIEWTRGMIDERMAAFLETTRIPSGTFDFFHFDLIRDAIKDLALQLDTEAEGVNMEKDYFSPGLRMLHGTTMQEIVRGSSLNFAEVLRASLNLDEETGPATLGRRHWEVLTHQFDVLAEYFNDLSRPAPAQQEPQAVTVWARMKRIMGGRP